MENGLIGSTDYQEMLRLIKMPSKQAMHLCVNGALTYCM